MAGAVGVDDASGLLSVSCELGAVELAEHGFDVGDDCIPVMKQDLDSLLGGILRW